jgi:hypothetical protein
VIAARAGNGVGIEGVAPDARLLALARLLAGGSATRCNSFTLAKAINYALLNGAQVINLSLSGPQDRLLQQLVEAAQARGIRVVGAVDPARPDGGFPPIRRACLPCGGRRAAAQRPARLAGAGTRYPHHLPGGRWGVVAGSSYAAAHVSGMLALLEELAAAARGPAARQHRAQRGQRTFDRHRSLCHHPPLYRKMLMRVPNQFRQPLRTLALSVLPWLLALAAQAQLSGSAGSPPTTCIAAFRSATTSRWRALPSITTAPRAGLRAGRW